MEGWNLTSKCNWVPLPILFEALTSAMGEEEKEEELVDITRKFGHDLGGYCKIPSFALGWF